MATINFADTITDPEKSHEVRLYGNYASFIMELLEGLDVLDIYDLTIHNGPNSFDYYPGCKVKDAYKALTAGLTDHRKHVLNMARKTFKFETVKMTDYTLTIGSKSILVYPGTTWDMIRQRMNRNNPALSSLNVLNVIHMVLYEYRRMMISYPNHIIIKVLNLTMEVPYDVIWQEVQKRTKEPSPQVIECQVCFEPNDCVTCIRCKKLCCLKCCANIISRHNGCLICPYCRLESRGDFQLADLKNI